MTRTRDCITLDNRLRIAFLNFPYFHALVPGSCHLWSEGRRDNSTTYLTRVAQNRDGNENMPAMISDSLLDSMSNSKYSPVVLLGPEFNHNCAHNVLVQEQLSPLSSKLPHSPCWGCVVPHRNSFGPWRLVRHLRRPSISAERNRPNACPARTSAASRCSERSAFASQSRSRRYISM